MRRAFVTCWTSGQLDRPSSRRVGGRGALTGAAFAYRGRSDASPTRLPGTPPSVYRLKLYCSTCRRGPVRSRSLHELRALRINGIEPIPTLDEALDAFPEQCFTVDLKDEVAIEPLVKSLQRKGVAERVCIAGAWDGWLGHVRSEVPEVTTALGWRALTALLTCARTGVRPPKALATAPFAHVPVKLGRVPIFVERLSAMSHDIGVRVVTWTVDEPVVIRRLLDAGVAAIITDRPDILREVLIQRGA
ncbi:MAG: glycerophosphodiester phosphodiesterase family protein [Dermatophilaceae bacterium]